MWWVGTISNYKDWLVVIFIHLHFNKVVAGYEISVSVNIVVDNMCTIYYNDVKLL